MKVTTFIQGTDRVVWDRVGAYTRSFVEWVCRILVPFKTRVRQPGVEPGSTAWKATMLTVTPLTPHREVQAFRVTYMSPSYTASQLDQGYVTDFAKLGLGLYRASNPKVRLSNLRVSIV